MRLKVIGCSPAWPNPGGARSGYLVEGDGRLLLDCGPGVLGRLRADDGGWPRVDRRRDRALPPRPLAFADHVDTVFDVREYREDEPFRAAGFDVVPLRLEHYSELTFGFRVSNHAGAIAYSGDTGPSPALAELARDADLFLCEATLREPEPNERGHLSEDEAVEAFDASGAKRLVVIHRPDELPLSPAVERAADGDVFELAEA